MVVASREVCAHQIGPLLFLFLTLRFVAKELLFFIFLFLFIFIFLFRCLAFIGVVAPKIDFGILFPLLPFVGVSSSFSALRRFPLKELDFVRVFSL